MKILHLVLVSSVFAFAPLAIADEIAYPTVEDASFVITAPGDWKVVPADEEGDYFDLEGPTGAVFSFRTIKGSQESLDQAIEEVVEDLNKDYKDVKIGEPQDWTPNGLQGFYAVGDGKDEDGPVRFGIGWCVLADGKIAELWFVCDASDETGMEVAGKIANSLKAP